MAKRQAAAKKKQMQLRARLNAEANIRAEKKRKEDKRKKDKAKKNAQRSKVQAARGKAQAKTAKKVNKQQQKKPQKCPKQMKQPPMHPAAMAGMYARPGFVGTNNPLSQGTQCPTSFAQIDNALY